MEHTHVVCAAPFIGLAIPLVAPPADLAQPVSEDEDDEDDSDDYEDDEDEEAGPSRKRSAPAPKAAKPKAKKVKREGEEGGKRCVDWLLRFNNNIAVYRGYPWCATACLLTA